jgi:hypothetical protein
MRYGILHHNKRNLPLAEAVAAAVRLFNQADHLRGLPPAELHFPPAEMPTDLEIGGLSVLPDAYVRPGCIRVTTYDAAPDAEMQMARRQRVEDARRAVVASRHNLDSMNC